MLLTTFFFYDLNIKSKEQVFGFRAIAYVFSSCGYANKDGYAYGYSSVYSTARTNCYTYSSSSSYYTYSVGQRFYSSYYYVYRSFFGWDTSGLPDNSSVVAANLSLYRYSDDSDTDFYIYVYNWSGGGDGLNCSDFTQHGNTSFGSYNTSGWVSGYNRIQLNSDGFNAISKNGFTYLMVRSSRDVDAIPPSGNEYVGFYYAEQGSGYCPLLSVKVVPFVDFRSPTPSNDSWVGGWFFVNVSTSYNVSVCSVVLNGTYYVMSNVSGTSWFRNVSGLSSNVYSYFVVCNDSSGDSGFSEVRSVRVDSVGPVVSFVSPTESSGVSVSRDWVVANVSVVEVNLFNFTYYLFDLFGVLVNNTTFSAAEYPSMVNWSSLSGGLYFYNASACDLAGNCNSTETRSIFVPYFISSCANITSSGVYYLIANVTDSSVIVCMNISADNVVLDCQGYIIDGVDTRDTYGVYVVANSKNVVNVSVRNCMVRDFGYGVFVYGSPGIYEVVNFSLFNSSVVSSVQEGVWLQSTNNANVVNVNVSESGGDDVFVYPYTTIPGECDNVFSNVLGSGGRPVGYYNYSVNLSNLVFSSLILCDAPYSNVSNVSVVGSGGLYNNLLLAWFVNYSRFIGINSSYNYYGAYILYSYFVNFSNSSLNNNGFVGFRCMGCNNFTVFNNSLRGNQWGFYLYRSSNNSLFFNVVSDSSGFGAYLYDAGIYGANRFYNNLFNNSNNFYFNGTNYTNFWNTTKSDDVNVVGLPAFGGNFWANPSGGGYSETCADVDWDGFCDDTYTLANGNVDYLALSNKFDSVGPGCSLSSIAESSSFAFVSGATIYYNNASSGSFNVSVSASDSGSGVNYTLFPDTVSVGGSVFNPGPYNWTYDWDSNDGNDYSDSIIYCYDKHGNFNTTNFSVVLDVTPPGGGFVGYENGFISKSWVLVNVSSGFDSQSGISDGSASLQLFVSNASLSFGSCGSFGSWYAFGSQTTSTTQINVTNLQNAYCYKFVYNVSDNVHNFVSYSNESIVKVDTQAPNAPPNLTVNDTSWSRYREHNFSWDTSTDSESGINGYYYDFDNSNPEETSNFTTNLFVVLNCSEGNHTLYVKAKDNAGNIGPVSTVSCLVYSEKGIISTEIGATPFYTTSANPQTKSSISCLANLQQGQSCNVSWIVNATGTENTNYVFFVFVNSSYSEITPSFSNETYIKIVSGTNTAPHFIGDVDDNSTISNPTRQGYNVVFTANASDDEGDMYRLIVCTTNSTTNGDCSSQEICSSNFVSSGTSASCYHNTSLETNYNYSWYAFVCDVFSACSESNYANSPYYINRKPIAFGVDISPRPATTSDDLTGNYSYFDADDDVEGNSVFAWYINGTKVKEGYVGEGIYLNKTEFGLGDRIILEITPCDASGFCGDANSSRVLFIGNSPPEKINLTSPANGDTTVHDRNTTFVWEQGFDADDDPLTYHLQLSNSSDFNYLIVNASEISGTSYTIPIYLELNKVYYWRVRAFDSQDYGEFSDVWNFSIEPILNITLISNATEFYTLSNNQENDTTDDNPEPFVVRNYGNYEVNISINATPLWQSVGLGTEYFKFKAGIYQGVLSFDYESSQVDWAYFAQEPQSIIRNLNYKFGNNSARIDIYVKVPAQEGAGYRSSIIEVSNT